MEEQKSKIVSYAIGFILVVSALLLVKYIILHEPTLDESLVKMSEGINKNCPMMLDDEVRLDNTTALLGSTLQYNYTLINKDRALTDTLSLKQNAEPLFVETIQADPRMKELTTRKVTFVYSYKDKNGDYLCSIRITPEKYGE